MSAFDRLTGALQYQIVNTLGFRELRPVQLQTIDAVMDGRNAVVLAPTAGGKTEAAFFPVLSRMDAGDWRPVSVLYLSPIRALLNNQEARVTKYAGLIGRRAFKWHGDTAQSARKRFLANPTDILLITPESLEAMLLSTRVPTREIFAGLRTVIIDEVHSFADDDRGAHLVAVLERLSRFCESDLQRLGLSATVGNPEEILRWLQGSSKRHASVVDPGGVKARPELSLDYVATMENAATVVEKLHPGRKRLVFVDSRRGAEQLGHLLTQQKVLSFVMHGSLSASQRRDAERAFEEGTDCVIVATSAMELGIDIGDLDHVLQIDSPATVASFLQRMGRTGRRGGSPNCTFLAVKDTQVLQAAALIQLHREGYVEPVRPSFAAYHILAHQLMSMAVQFGGIAPGDWFAWVEGATVFARIGADERRAMVAHMLGQGVLSDQEGKLWLGPVGEKRFGHSNFRELYAVFDAPRLVTVRAGVEDIGSVDATFLMALMEDGHGCAFTLGGKAWEVVHVEWERGLCIVRPVAEGRAPRWSGGGRFLGYDLCQAMARVLREDSTDESWSKRFCAVMTTLRAEYMFLRDDPSPLLRNGDTYEWFTFAGGAANILLARVLESMLGGKVTANDLRISFKDNAGESEVAIRQTIDQLAATERPTESDALAYASGESMKRLSKFDVCLPEAQLMALMRERRVDWVGARKAVEAWAGRAEVRRFDDSRRSRCVEQSFPLATVRELSERARRRPSDGSDDEISWTIGEIDPMEVVECFAPVLRVRDGYALRAYQFRAGGNGHGVVYAMPRDVELPNPPRMMEGEEHRWEPPLPPEGALAHYMEAIEGDGSAWSYLCASFLDRELSELHARWHGVRWGVHRLIDGAPWSGSKPGEVTEGNDGVFRSAGTEAWWAAIPAPPALEPKVRMEDSGAVVTFHTYSGFVREGIYRHTDTYPSGVYRAVHELEQIAVGPGGYIV